VHLHGSAGSIAMQVNGTPVDVVGVASINTGGTAWTGIALGGADLGPTVQFDDLYIADGSAGDVTDFLGDVHVEALEATGVGATTQWEVVGAANNYDAVDDDAAPDDDTSYVHTDVLNEVDTYQFSNVSFGPGTQIFGVQFSIMSRKNDPGDRAIAPIVRHGGGDYAGNNLFLTAGVGQYAVQHQVMEQNPATAAPWTVSDVNADEFGVKLSV
jgi:hypothetical protein